MKQTKYFFLWVNLCQNYKSHKFITKSSFLYHAKFQALNRKTGTHDNSPHLSRYLFPTSVNLFTGHDESMAVFRLQVGGDVDSRGAEKYPITIPMKNSTRPMPMHGIIIFLVFTSTIMYPAIPMFQKRSLVERKPCKCFKSKYGNTFKINQNTKRSFKVWFGVCLIIYN